MMHLKLIIQEHTSTLIVSQLNRYSVFSGQVCEAQRYGSIQCAKLHPEISYSKKSCCGVYEWMLSGHEEKK